jgi:hypothetical protein
METELDAIRFQWLADFAVCMDAVADPDNFVQVWYDTASGSPVIGRNLREAVDNAILRQTGKPINKQQPVLGHAANGFICPWDSEGRVCSQNKK